MFRTSWINSTCRIATAIISARLRRDEAMPGVREKRREGEREGKKGCIRRKVG